MPNNWKTRRLKDISALITSGSRGWAGYYADEGAKFIRMTNLPRNGIYLKLDDLKYVKLPANNSEGSRTLLKDGDVLVSITAELGKIGYVSENLGEAYINQHVALVRFRTDEIIPKFMAYLLSTVPYRNALNRRNDSGAKAGLNLPTLQSFPVDIPEKDEQAQIVSILEKWDDYIEKLESQIRLKSNMKRALVQKLVSGNKRIPGFAGDWQSVTLDDLINKKKLEVGRGNVISKTDIENYPGTYPIFSSSVKNDGLFGKYGKYMFDEEMISWSVDGGGHFFYRPKGKFSVTNVSGWLKVKSEDISCRFLALQLQMLHGRLLFDYQFKAHPSVIRNMYVLSLPTVEEQNAIADIIDNITSEISLLNQKKTYLIEQKNYLVHMLTSGKIRTSAILEKTNEELQHA